MMNKREISRILPVAATIAIAASLIGGAGLSGLAQTTESSQDLSGTVNSLVQEDGVTTYVIGGEWELSVDSDSVTDFSADLVMTEVDGTGAHSHRIVIADEGIDPAVELEDEPTGDIQVTLTPEEQNVGGSVLVNATGVSGNGTTTVKVGDIIAGNPESDEDGNVLFALGVTEDMIGSQTVTVEAEGSSGSAPFTALQLENATDIESGNTTTTDGNLTTTDNTGNLTDSTGNMTDSTSDMTEGSTDNMTSIAPSSDTTDDSIYGTTIDGSIYDSESEDTGSSDLSTTSDSTDDTPDSNPDGELTTFEEEAIAAGEVFEDMEGFDNATSTTSTNATDSTNATSDDTGAPGDSEAGITMSFEVVADIYTDDELMWEDVNITVSVMNGQVVTIEIDPIATENHFGDQPIYGIADT